MKVTHANIWKRLPSVKNSFVSNEVSRSFPYLKRKKVQKVLDVACGNGLGVSVPLMAQGYDVYSFDKWKASIAALEKNARAGGFRSHGRVSDMYKTFPYSSESFDATFCFQAIYHGTLEQIEFTLNQLRRVTKKGGYFFGTFMPYQIKTHAGRSFFNYTKKDGSIGRIYVKVDQKDPHLTFNLDKNCEYMVPHYYFTVSQLRKTLKKFFKTVSITQLQRPDKCVRVLFVRCTV